MEGQSKKKRTLREACIGGGLLPARSGFGFSVSKHSPRINGDA
jgi:hypothetical protein